MSNLQEILPTTSKTRSRRQAHTAEQGDMNYASSNLETSEKQSMSLDSSPTLDSEKVLYNTDLQRTDESQANKRKKRRQKKKVHLEKADNPIDPFPDDGVMAQLEMLDESDIIRCERKPDIFTIATHQSARSSKLNSKAYLEVRGGFKAVDQLKMMDPRLPFPILESPKSHITAKEAALGVQSWFRKVATLSHGLLAGLALCQALTVWLLAPPLHSWQDFVEHYTHIAYPFYATSHFLLIICVISVFDRFDVCKFQWHAIREQMGCGLELLTLLLYPLALSVALMGADRDIRLGHFHKSNSTIWWEERQTIEKELEEWKLLILIKCVAAVLSWFLLGTHPTWDQFYQRLKGSKES